MGAAEKLAEKLANKGPETVATRPADSIDEQGYYDVLHGEDVEEADYEIAEGYP